MINELTRQLLGFYLRQKGKENIMGGLGTTEILLIVLALFLLFGASRLPQLAKSLGATRKAFKDGMKEAEEEERIENRQKQMNSAPVTPQITSMSDDELAAEMRRRAEVNAIKN